MKWKKIFAAAAKSIWKNGTRSLLTALGIIIGVGAVIVMVAIGTGSQRDIEQRIQSLGTNLLMVRPGANRFGGINRGAGSAQSLTLEDAEALRQYADHLEAVSAAETANGQVIAGAQNWSTSIEGVAPSYPSIRRWDVARGTFFTERQVETRAKVAVLGQTVAEELFGNADPIGKQFRVNNVPFTVIGVMAEKGQDPRGRDQDDILFAPISTVMYRLTGERSVGMIYASATGMDVMDKAQSSIETTLRLSHRLGESEDNDFNVRSQSEIVEMASGTAQTMTLLLGAVAAVSLVVGGIGIMNIMLVSVTERTREIGIRLSVGARERDVLVQFLIEAVLLSLAGGALGVGLSVVVCEALTRVVGMTTVIEPTIVALAMGFSAAVGIFFGLYPARKAAKLDPIEALRYE
jgi:putative ABC transport system permease protein